MFKTETLSVNSYHHQAINEIANELQPMAYSEDGLIEAVYMPNRNYVYAVQWHPEYMLNDTQSQALFNSFVSACKSQKEY